MKLSKNEPTTWKHDGGLVANFFVSVVLGPLPGSWRRPIEDRLGLNVHTAAVASGVIQLFLFIGLWAIGYWFWYHAIDAELTEAARRLDSTGKYDQESYNIIGASALGMNPFMTLIYSLTSPAGILTSLGTLGGLTRTIGAAATGENYPDLTLGVIEGLRLRLTSKGRAKLRERAKGDESPDRLEMGEIAADGYDLRITTAWDFDWSPGNSIIVAGEPFFLVDRRDVRDAQGRLRVQYDLRRLRVGEIVRAPKPYRPTSPPEIVTR